MGFVKTGVSAIGKLILVAALLATFLVGLIGVVYLSLGSKEVKVPEIIGKDKLVGENELASLNLKIKQRATRFSQEKANTILEQLPKAGDTVKEGQTISVVIARSNPEGEEAPAEIEKNVNENKSVEDKEKEIQTKLGAAGAVKKKKVDTNKNDNDNSTKKPASGNSNNSNKSNKNSGSNGNDNSSNNSGNKNSNGKPTSDNKAPTSGGAGKTGEPTTIKTPVPKPPTPPASNKPTSGEVRPRTNGR